MPRPYDPFDPAPLLGDLEITFDVDLLAEADGPAEPVSRGLRASMRAALFDMRTGNESMPAAALDLRDPIGAVAEIYRTGAAAVRFFPEEQGIQPDFPSVRFVARAAAEAGKVILTGGDVRLFWKPLAGLGANVVFLDTHFYHLGDFLVAAADEPGFHTSTRLLTSPDALEQVTEHLGVQRLCFGSRAPLYEPLVPMLRLATSTLSAQEKAMVAGGNALRLLGVF
jgi:predicted TIM-barrel fold metal-dependent hydrolase